MQNEVIRLRDLAEGRQDMLFINPLDIVVEEGFNPRDFSLPGAREKLDTLKAQIKAVGVEQPLWVRWDFLNAQDEQKSAILVDGGRRLKAVLELIAEGHDIKRVPVLQKGREKGVGNPADRLLLALTANTGEPLQQTEVGQAFRRLLAFGWTVAEIATKMGQSQRYVNDAIELSTMAPEVKQMVNSGEVTRQAAIKISRQQGERAAATLKAKVEEAKATGGKVTAGKKEAAKLVSASQKLLTIGSFVETALAQPESVRTAEYLYSILTAIREQLGNGPGNVPAQGATTSQASTYVQ